MDWRNAQGAVGSIASKTVVSLNPERQGRFSGSTGTAIRLVICTLYFLSIALLRPTPWLDLGTTFSFEWSLIWAALPLAVGFALNRPSTVVAGFLLAMLGPFHRTSIIVAFLTGLIMLGRVVVENRHRFGAFVLDAIRGRGFWAILMIAGYLVFTWLLNYGTSTDAWSLWALSSTLLTVPFAVYSLYYLPWNEAEVGNAIRWGVQILVGLCMAVLIYPAIAGEWVQYPQAVFVYHKTIREILQQPYTMEWVNPDFNWGSLASAHYVAFIAMILTIGVSIHAIFTRRWRWFGLAALSLMASSMGENAHMLPGFVVGIGVFVIIRFTRTLRPGVPVTLLSSGAIVLLLGSIAFPIYSVYIHGRYAESQKGILYRSALEQLNGNWSVMLFGYGPAGYGSRAASKRLPSELRTIEHEFPFTVREFSSPAYTEAIRESLKGVDGSTPYRAFPGFLAIVMEWGMVGSLLLVIILTRFLRQLITNVVSGDDVIGMVLGATASIGVMGILYSTIFRQYLEYPEVMAYCGMIGMTAILRRHHWTPAPAV